MIIGTLAGAATLGLMIPPSLTLIVYGVTINESITKLFMAGVIPGLVLAGLFMSYIVGWYYLRPSERPEQAPRQNLMQVIKDSRFLIPGYFAGYGGDRLYVFWLGHRHRSNSGRGGRGLVTRRFPEIADL